MDIAFDRKSWTQDPARPAGGETAPLEWHGLLARLIAARAAHRALLGDGSAGDLAGTGSFDGGSARAVAEYGIQLPGVNPVFWADGKPAQSMDGTVAGQTSTGERG